MRRFYSTRNELNFFTLSANSLLFNQPCPHCQCSEQWVSHGFSYSQSGDVRGKRIVCCARFGKQGCGRTIALYLASILPKRRYALLTLYQFIKALLLGSTIELAYYHALGHHHHGHRQAYRWLNALYARCGDFREFLFQKPPPVMFTHHRSKRLSSLLTTLRLVLSHYPDLASYQHKMNHPFC